MKSNFSNSTSTSTSSSSSSSSYYDTIVIGAGLSGVAAGYRIQTRLPNQSYIILEGRDTVGGTWDLFRYPGIRSDSDMFTLVIIYLLYLLYFHSSTSHLFSYSSSLLISSFLIHLFYSLIIIIIIIKIRVIVFLHG